MNLFSRVKAHVEDRQEIINEYEGVIAVRDDYVQIYGVKSFFKYSNCAIPKGGKVEIKERESDHFDYEATFSVDGIKYLIVLTDAEKEELEKLINEREAEESTNGIKTI